MKKISLYIIMAVSLLASCRRYDDHIFDKSPEERINEVMNRYQAAIAGATDGWQGQLRTGDSSYFSFYFRFNNDNRVVMMSDYSRETASTLRESSYRLKALQNPTLIFDTYSYLHILADPDASANGGAYGTGRTSDFEYTIDTVSTDSIHLTGRFNGTIMTMKKATAAQRAAWEGKQISAGIASVASIGNIQKYFKRLSLNGTQYEIQIDTFSKRTTFTWGTPAAPNSVTRGYYVAAGGLQFSDPIAGPVTITGMNIGSFSGGALNVTVNGTNATIIGADAPLIPDTKAFSRFRAAAITAGSYYVTVPGFHVNGVDNAHNVTSLATDSSTYIYTLYWPEFDPGIDLMAPIFFHTVKRQADLPYGIGVQATDLTDGRARIRDIGEIPPYPTSGPAFAMRNQLNVSGLNYWFVQVGPENFDMVSAADARVWISWRLF